MAIAESYARHSWRPFARNILHGPDARGIQVDTPDAGYLPPDGRSGCERCRTERPETRFAQARDKTGDLIQTESGPKNYLTRWVSIACRSGHLIFAAATLGLFVDPKRNSSSDDSRHRASIASAFRAEILKNAGLVASSGGLRVTWRGSTRGGSLHSIDTRARQAPFEGGRCDTEGQTA